jgi:hypothetical protein
MTFPSVSLPLCVLRIDVSNKSLNPPASAFTAAYRGTSEHKQNASFFLRIEDFPQLAAEGFN